MSQPGRDDEMRAIVREILGELVPATAGATGHHGNGKGHGNGPGNGNGTRPSRADDAPVVPQVPAPPVPAVLRPSTWKQPPIPGEVIGDAPAGPAPTAAGNPRREALRTAFQESEFRPGAATAPVPPSGHPPSSAPAATGEVRQETVVIDTEQDLQHFIRQLMSRLENPRERVAIRTGRLRFNLQRSPGRPAPGASAPAAAVTRVERGAVTERMIRAAAEEGATRLVLAPAAVLTPLAREQARARGVEIERERRC